jgi:histidinol dehydrogenase
MKRYTNPSKETWRELCSRPQLELEFIDSSVRNILARVQKSGDAALVELTLQFDKIVLDRISISQNEIEEADALLPSRLKSAIAIAAENIEKFHTSQRREVTKIETSKGVTCWRKGIPINKIGIYIPGGTAPLFSTVLMLGIPAMLAGCEEVILCTPPNIDGKINPTILYAAKLVGIKSIFKIGGAQAIAAMAYGTESVPSVFKIFGPGNQFVTKAKQLVSYEGIAIDLPAGPSEVLVLVDETCNAEFVAADLLSQAEHGEDSQVILVTTTKTIIDSIALEIKKQIDLLPRKSIAEKALLNSRAIFFSRKADAINFINEYAPEHLILSTQNPERDSELIVNAGSVFLGQYAAESIGDYASGTNHTLPTNGNAKAFSGVSLDSFLKYITYQQVSKEGLLNIGPVVEQMASAEGLEAHKQAISIRLSTLTR